MRESRNAPNYGASGYIWAVFRCHVWAHATLRRRSLRPNLRLYLVAALPVGVKFQSAHRNSSIQLRTHCSRATTKRSLRYIWAALTRLSLQRTVVTEWSREGVEKSSLGHEGTGGAHRTRGTCFTAHGAPWRRV